jgi:hypothetical protein
MNAGLRKQAAASEPVAAASTASNDLSVCTARRHRLALPVPTRWGKFESSSGRRAHVDKEFLACWPLDRAIRHTVDADKHPVAAPTVLIAA